MCTWGRGVGRKKTADFNFGQIKFEMSVRCPGKEIQWAFVYASLKIRQEVKSGNQQYALKLSWDCQRRRYNIGSGLRMTTLKEIGGEKGPRTVWDGRRVSKIRVKSLQVVVNNKEDIISNVKCSTEI